MAGSAAGREWAVCWFDGDRLTAFLGVDQARDALQARKLITAGTALDPAKAADPSVPLKKAAR